MGARSLETGAGGRSEPDVPYVGRRVFRHEVIRVTLTFVISPRKCRQMRLEGVFCNVVSLLKLASVAPGREHRGIVYHLASVRSAASDADTV